jgi:hypothetical protein
MNLDIGHPWIVDKTGGQAEVRLDLYRTLLGTCQPKNPKSCHRRRSVEGTILAVGNQITVDAQPKAESKIDQSEKKAGK